MITSCLFAPLAVHLVDVWNMIEAFRDNGLNTLDHNAEINVSRLETILSSIYYQLNKRLPTTHQINVEQSIGLLLNFMVATYDRYGGGSVYCSSRVTGGLTRFIIITYKPSYIPDLQRLLINVAQPISAGLSADSCNSMRRNIFLQSSAVKVSIHCNKTTLSWLHVTRP